MFDLRRLRLLHELALRGTLSAVAEALAYSPSAVSQQLALLEREAGVSLIEPDGRRVRLTPHGHFLAAHAARMIELDERARLELASVQTGLAPVRLGVMQTAAQSLVPRAMTLLAERAPGLRVDMTELAPEQGLFELTARRVDLVVAEQYRGHQRDLTAGIHRELVGRDPLRLVLPADAGAHGTLTAMRDRAWVLEPLGTAAREWALQQCRAAGFEPEVRFESADLVSHIRLISAGHAVGILPDLVWGAPETPVRLVPLPGHPVREVFSAVREASLPSAGIALVREALRDAFEAHTVHVG